MLIKLSTEVVKNVDNFLKNVKIYLFFKDFNSFYLTLIKIPGLLKNKGLTKKIIHSIILNDNLKKTFDKYNIYIYN